MARKGPLRAVALDNSATIAWWRCYFAARTPREGQVPVLEAGGGQEVEASAEVNSAV